MFRKGRKIVLEKPDKVIELLEGEFADIQGITEASLAEIWEKKGEDVWNHLP